MEKRERFARTILNGFESYFAEFQNITLAARSRFENADWLGMHAASIERIDLYKEKTHQIIQFVELIAGDQLRDFQFWSESRMVYADLIKGHNNFEIAETFFNSVYCAVFKHRKIRDEYAFVFSPQGDMPPADVSAVYSRYRKEQSLSELLRKLLMPAKPISEIYSPMGYNKHGKTYYHRCAYRHMTSTSDQFIIAPGIKGMVMTVFTMPSYDFVFKIIKDRFTPPKDMTRDQVKAKYALVKRWDRVGRMADTQEFTNLAFARERFSDELMEELRTVAPSMIEEHGTALVIKHVYVERRMTPLNLYLRDASDEQVRDVMDEYGNAIKQLAAANIFPGDMLLKNFGVTRHGRVVFYDYDEIQPLLDCDFRKIPEPRSEEEEMASQPWYSVGPNDIFPEEFRLLFSGNQRARKVFDEMHSDVYQAEFWQGLQQQIKSGYVDDFFPYRRKLRFDRTPKTETEIA